MNISYKYHWISAIVNYKLEEINNVYTAHKVILMFVTSYCYLYEYSRFCSDWGDPKSFLPERRHKPEASIWNPVTQACALGKCVKEPQDSGKELEDTN